MKNSMKIMILFIITIVCIITIVEIKHCENDREIYVQQKLDESHKYLLKKYGEKIDVELLNYSFKDSFMANYLIVDSPDVTFRVAYWENRGQYYDNYIEQLLTNELKGILYDTILKLGLSNTDVDIYVGTMVGPPFDLSNRLYEYYHNLGRIPKISDIKHKEMFSSVTISINNELDDNRKRTINEVILKLNLPIEKIKVE